MLNPDKSGLGIDLSAPAAIPEQAIEDAVALMRTGRLHRYGEYAGAEPHVALLEKAYAEYVGTRYCVGINSGGCAIFLGLKVAGVKPGDKVLVNAFNLAPVPGAIEHTGAESILVEIDPDFCIDLDDLEQKAASSAAKVLLITHMRGHIADMDKVTEICRRHQLKLVEDCAHTMGAKWRGKFTGTFGEVGCFSTQTFKHINSGEGGLLVTDDDEMAASAILYSGSYMLYDQHRSSPPLEVFDRLKKQTPNFSMRMSNLVACLLRVQLKEMPARGERWNAIYRNLENRLNTIAGISVPERHADEEFVASSIQFHITGLDSELIRQFADQCTDRGVAIKWFGRDEPMGYTSQYHHWQYIKPQNLPDTRQVLRTTCDMRIPLSLTDQDCAAIEQIIRQQIESITNP